MESRRADGRGHWPAGKSRNRPRNYKRTLNAVARWIEKHAPYVLGPPESPDSCRGLARHLGVDQRTVRRWLDGEDLPSDRVVEAMRKWLARRKA